MGKIEYAPVDALRKAIRSSNMNSMKGTQEYVVSENKAILTDYEFVDCGCAEDCWCKSHGCTGHYVIREMTFERFLETYVHLWVPPRARNNVRRAVLEGRPFNGRQRNAVGPLQWLMQNWKATLNWARQHRKCGLCDCGVPRVGRVNYLYEAKIWSQLFYDSLAPFDSSSRSRIKRAGYTDPIRDYARMNRELFEDLRRLASRANLGVPALRGLDAPSLVVPNLVPVRTGQPLSRVLDKIFYRPQEGWRRKLPPLSR